MKIAKGDYSELVKTIKKLVTDSNQMVSLVSIKISAQLAKALR